MLKDRVNLFVNIALYYSVNSDFYLNFELNLFIKKDY